MSYRLLRLNTQNTLKILMLGLLTVLVGCGDHFEASSSSGSDLTSQQSAAQQSTGLREVTASGFDVVENYEMQCLACHGADSEMPDTQLIQEQWDTVPNLAAILEAHRDLEDGTSVACTGECAQATASYMIDTLNLPILYVNQAQSLYVEQCAACHGAQGEGGSGGPIQLGTCNSCGSLEELIQRTTDTMPPQNTGLCVGTCAVETSKFIKANYMEIFASSGVDGSMNTNDDENSNDDPNDNPNENSNDQPGVDPGVVGTLTCDDTGKATVFADTVYENVLAPNCSTCHASFIANGSLFKMTDVVAENYPLFVDVADALYDVNGEPLLLVRAIDDDGQHGGGPVLMRDSDQAIAVAAMIEVLSAEGGACEAPFRTLYESSDLPFPGMAPVE